MRIHKDGRSFIGRKSLLVGAGALAAAATAWAAAPGNDAFTSAETLSGASVSVNGTNVDATFETGEPNDYGSKATVWYAWTAPAAGKYRVRIGPSAGADERFQPALSVFTGSSVAGLTYVDLGYGLEYDWDTESGPRALQASAGTRYLFQVNSDADWVFDPVAQTWQRMAFTGPFSLAIDEIPAPVNDDFDDALVLTGDTFATGGVTEAASLESSEPKHDLRQSNGRSVWYRWTAPRTTRVLVASDGLLTGVYTGSAVNALTRVGQTDANDYSDYDQEYGDSGQFARFDAVAGTTYSIAVDDGGDQWYGETAFHLRSFVAPANDHRADATVVSGAYVAISGSSVLSTHEAGEAPNFLDPNYDYYGATPGSVWYAWTAPASGRASLTSTDGRFVAMGVFTEGTAGALTNVGARFDAVAGTRYLIAVDGFTFSLRLSMSAGNDAFDHATDLAGSIVSTSGANVGSGTELGEPLHAGNGYASAWWDWTAPSTGDFLVSTAGSNFDTVLAVYTGGSVRTLDRVAENDDAGTLRTSRVVLHAQSGTVYHIAVAAPAGLVYDDMDGGYYLNPSAAETGQIQLSIRPGSETLSPNLSADRSAVTVDEGIEFSAGAAGGSQYAWEFGDGETLTTSVNHVEHSYDRAGTFHVKVTASDGTNEATDTLDVVVSEDLPFVVSAFNATLNFKKQNRDSVTVTGSLGLPQSTPIANQSVVVDVGGITRTFNLDANGAAVVGKDSIKVTAKPGRNAKLVLRLAKASLQADLADEGLDNADASAKPVLVDVAVTLGSVTCDTTVQAYWTAKAGKSGVAK